MIGRLLGALQFLTTLPVRRSTVPTGRAALFFPLVGALLGLVGGGWFLLVSWQLPRSLAALTTLGLWLMLTGGLHEDGLADVTDAFRAGRSPSRILAIMLDSRIGTYGALALIVAMIARWQGLIETRVDVLRACVLAQCVPRAAMVLLAYVSRPAGGGIAAHFLATLTWREALGATLQGYAALFLLPHSALPIVAGLIGLLPAAQTYCYRRIGGLNGDCFGAFEQCAEIWIWLVLACPAFT